MKPRTTMPTVKERRSKLRSLDLDTLLTSAAKPFVSWHVREPPLVFHGGLQSPDPKTGLSLLGPWGTPEEEPLRQIRVGIIGTGQTVQEARNWLDRCRQQVCPVKTSVDEQVDPILFPSFPGMETKAGFNCKLDVPNTEVIAPLEEQRIVGAGNRDAAVEETVKVIRQRLQVLAEKESPPQVVLIALPNAVREIAGAGRQPSTRAAAAPSEQLQIKLAFMDERPVEERPASRTLHRAIKAEGMRVGLPTQLAWPGAFSVGGAGVEDDATRAWNFCVALYYKAGGIPWRVTGLAKNTCYVGISFYRPLGETGKLSTSMAQAFSDRGDGLVLRGEAFDWDFKKERRSPHLSRDHAKRLLENVLEHYTQHMRQTPVRVVVHKSSEFEPQEMEGFQQAIPESVPFHEFLSIRRSRIRFLRVGTEPPVRGTLIQVAPRRYVMYTGGYVPYLRVYPGLRIPRPLLILHEDGSGPATDIASEVMSLTRLNWNSAAFAEAKPITLGFAEDIGLILAELPPDVTPKMSYRFYM
jgi:hypothetical protein